MRTVNLWVTELGQLEVEVSRETTLLQIVNEHNLQGYDFTVGSTVISRDDWGTTSVYDARDIWASKGVKGAC